MCQWSVRRAQPEDTKALADVIERAYEPARKSGIDLPDVAGGIADDIRDHLVWVAAWQAQIGGVIVVIPDPDKARLANIAVDPSARGQGVGKALIACVVGYLQQQGVPQLALTTHVEMPENVQLYRHLGWRETGRDEGKVYMTRELI